jgi:hypothetical protein
LQDTFAFLPSRSAAVEKPEPPSKNRRRCRRRQPKRTTRLACHAGAFGMGPDMGGGVLDLSEEGVRLRVKARLSPGQEIEVSLDSVNHRRPVKLIADVIWVVPADDGTYCVGARFQRPLRYADLEGLAYS